MLFENMIISWCSGTGKRRFGSDVGSPLFFVCITQH